MKPLLILFLYVLILFSCTRKAPLDVGELNNEEFESFELDLMCAKDESLILFKDKMVDFSNIKKKDGTKLVIFFPYANIGNSRLVILKTDVFCGCLSVNYHQRPLVRGETGLIKVLVNINGQQGVFNKTVFVKSNACNDVEIIRIKGFIE